MTPQILSQSQAKQLDWYLRNIRKAFNEAIELGEREFIRCFELFNGAITLRVCAFNDWREGIYSLDDAINQFGKTIEIVDYNTQDLIDMFGEENYDDAIEEITKIAMNS